MIPAPTPAPARAPLTLPPRRRAAAARRFPVWTLLLAAAATAAYAVPGLSASLVFDRQQIAAGQAWRLLTGNLVHLSAAHWGVNVVALLLVGTVVEARRHRAVLGLYLVAALAVGGTVLLALPGIDRYGGLSGIVTAAIAAVLLDGVADDRPRRALWAVGLLLLVAKLGIEASSGTFLLVAVTGAPFTAVAPAHLAGATAAVAWWALSRGMAGVRTARSPAIIGHAP